MNATLLRCNHIGDTTTDSPIVGDGKGTVPLSLVGRFEGQCRYALALRPTCAREVRAAGPSSRPIPDPPEIALGCPRRGNSETEAFSPLRYRNRRGIFDAETDEGIDAGAFVGTRRMQIEKKGWRATRPPMVKLLHPAEHFMAARNTIGTGPRSVYIYRMSILAIPPFNDSIGVSKRNGPSQRR